CSWVVCEDMNDSQVSKGAPPATYVPLPYVAPPDVDVFAGMFLDKSEIAKEVRERLRYKVCIRIAPHGIFRTHRYAERDQVVAVGGDRVTLSVPESKLIKG